MFIAKTCHSGKLKALFEVLYSNVQTVCLTISATGIKSEAITTQNALICVDLPAASFDEYAFTFSEPQYVGLGSHVNQFFKSLKNKTTVSLTITRPFTLDIEISSNVDDSCMMKYSATIVSAQNVAPIPIAKYTSPGIEISNVNFNQMCKSFSKSLLIDVTKRDGQIYFSFELAGIATKTLRYGTERADTALFYQSFKSDSFARIGKLASFSSGPIVVYADVDKPLMIEAKSQIGIVYVLLTGMTGYGAC
jgi:hypothetical protein